MGSLRLGDHRIHDVEEANRWKSVSRVQTRRTPCSRINTAVKASEPIHRAVQRIAIGNVNEGDAAVERGQGCEFRTNAPAL